MIDSTPPDFIPVPVRARRDGWTPERQRRFIALLAGGMPSNHAAKAIGMSKQTAHALRARAGAQSFAAAWDDAAASARKARLTAAASKIERAIDGILIPVVYGGKVIGRERRFDNALLCRLISIAERTEAQAASRGGKANSASNRHKA